MTSTNTWKGKRDVKRRDLRAQRTDNHRQELRRQGSARGMKGVAEAEWNILRSAVTSLPEQRRDEEWKTVATVLRQLAEALSGRHRP